MPEVADPTRRFRLDDNVVILTGASSGLGAQWTAALAGAGAKLVVTTRRVAELAAIAERVGALAIAGDLTSEDHRRHFCGRDARSSWPHRSTDQQRWPCSERPGD